MQLFTANIKNLDSFSMGFIIVILFPLWCAVQLPVAYQLDPKTIKVEHRPLLVRPLIELANVLNHGMKNDFKFVNVDVVDSPDFRRPPFNLVSEGINGRTRVVEVGGPGYLLPLANLTRIYDLKDVAKFTKVDNAFIIGATSGPFPYVGVNSEEIVNIKLNNYKNLQGSIIYKVNPSTGKPVEQYLPPNETRVAIMGNIFVSEGKPGKVLKVHVRKRISDNDFIASIRTVLAERYGSNIIGMGGVIWVKEGIVSQHIMPDFSKTPINDDNELNDWLYFYNMTAPLYGVGTFVTGNYSLDLRLQHFHTYSYHGEGGHYHVDVTPEIVEYLGYFVPGERVYRVDQPPVHRDFGRDK